MTTQPYSSEQPSAETSLKTRERHWGRYLLVGGLVVVVASVVGVYIFAQRPAQGVLKQTALDAPSAPVVVDVPEVFVGTYVSFMYSSRYILKSHETEAKPGDVILERVYLSETSAISKKIGLTVRNLPSRNLEDDPDYKMREIWDKKYKKEAFSHGNVSGTAFVSADGGQFEKTFFIQSGNLVAGISVSAPALWDEALDKEANTIAGSLSWIHTR